MSRRFCKWILPVILLLLAVLFYQLIQFSHSTPAPEPAPDVVLRVRTQLLQPQSLTIAIEGFAAVEPVERTLVASQVAGEVVQWHPQFVAGGMVERGTVLFSLDKSNYQAAVLQMEAELAQAQAAYIEEKARGKVAEQQARSIPDKQVTDLYLRKPQRLSALARVKSARAGLQKAQRDLANCDIKAPYDALVIARQIGVGQYVNVGSTVAELYNIESAQLVVPIAGFDAPFLPFPLSGQAAQLSVAELPDQVWHGQIARDLGVVDSATRMVQLVVTVNDPYGIKSAQPVLPFGRYVSVKFSGLTLPQLYRVPQELVRDNTVWLLDANNQLQPRQVRVRRQSGAYFYLDQGIEPGDELVLTPPEFPYPGMPAQRVLASADKEASRE